jgi:hypothetical protein
MLTDAYWEKRFGADWKNKDKTFWKISPIMIENKRKMGIETLKRQWLIF